MSINGTFLLRGKALLAGCVMMHWCAEEVCEWEDEGTKFHDVFFNAAVATASLLIHTTSLEKQKRAIV
jgi:hypothetical protein